MRLKLELFSAHIHFSGVTQSICIMFIKQVHVVTSCFSESRIYFSYYMYLKGGQVFITRV